MVYVVYGLMQHLNLFLKVSAIIIIHFEAYVFGLYYLLIYAKIRVQNTEFSFSLPGASSTSEKASNQ